MGAAFFFGAFFFLGAAFFFGAFFFGACAAATGWGGGSVSLGCVCV